MQAYIKLPNGFVATVRTNLLVHQFNQMIDTLVKDQCGIENFSNSYPSLRRDLENAVQRREKLATAKPGMKFPVHHLSLVFDEVIEGQHFREHINQGLRDCYVIDVKKTRYRIEFDMPTCTQQGWRTGVRFNNKVCRVRIEGAKL